MGLDSSHRLPLGKRRRHQHCGTSKAFTALDYAMGRGAVPTAAENSRKKPLIS